MMRSRFFTTALCLLSLALPACIRIPVSQELKRMEALSYPPISAPPALPAGQKKDPDVLVWMLADEIHTGMVFPLDWLVESGFRPPAGFPKSKFVTMSWGNRQAYLQRSWLTPWQAFRALCTPSPSVMEIIPFDYDVVEVCHYQHIWRKLVPRDRGPALAAFLNGCVSHAPDGRPIVLGSSSWGNKGVIVESPYHYMIPRVCNTWTVQTMEAMGCEMDPFGATTANGVIKQAERNQFQKVWDAYDKKKD